MKCRIAVPRVASARPPFLEPIALVLLFAAPSPAQVTNAPVAPDTIYVARTGAAVGLSVIDLNGFGGGTGNPTFDPVNQAVEGNSNYPNNPNVRLQGSLLGLQPGTTTLDGGSAGVFTLTKNSVLDDLVLRAPSVVSIGDMMLGAPLDLSYNNGPAPFGCDVGGGNLCAFDGKMVVEVAGPNGNTVQPSFAGGTILNTVVAGGNPISWAPHPNPPPLIAVPLCLQPSIGAQEPITIEDADDFSNLLVPGDPFGIPALGVPPSGLLSLEQNSYFIGPSLPQALIQGCQEYMYRQQVGHFLYMTDRERGEIVVLNSDTMRVLKRIAVVDPTELAMGTNLDFLAVTQRALDQVSFIDIDPRSATFHEVVQFTPVGDAPSGIAWDPGNEDVLVCNEGDDSVSIIATSSLAVRKTVTRRMDRPFAVAITQRQSNFGLLRNVYFAYILDRAGHVSLFESGPSSVNGWGYDEIIGRTSFVFANPTALQPDPLRLSSGVWIAHEGQLASDGTPTGLSGGAVTNLVLDGTAGMIPLGVQALADPHMRDLSFQIERSIGSDQLTGIPLDLAFDDLRNLGALPNAGSVFSSGEPAAINGKSQVRNLPEATVLPTNRATYLFVPIRGATPGSEAVDVIRLRDGVRFDTNAFHSGTQSIPASGAALVIDYFRQ